MDHIRNIGYFFGYLKYLKEYMVEYNSLEIMVRFAIAYLGYYITILCTCASIIFPSDAGGQDKSRFEGVTDAEIVYRENR